ncbi:unnamed protein product [Brachionus calyciflorus]|uniref:Uncharacterized protein n=1 Tax=Brachionus calyciflorus TaxID=104777 RepID=A0A814FV74_9BILA|nr:unnamed protein product [Brachionus calyciflorus]
MTRNRSISVFISLRRLHENRWLLELLLYLPINTLTDHTQASVILPVLPPLLQPLNYQPENPVQAQPPVIQARVIPPVLPQQFNQPVNPAPVTAPVNPAPVTAPVNPALVNPAPVIRPVLPKQNNPAQLPQPIPVINVYPRVVLNIDANALINRLGIGRGRMYRSTIELNPRERQQEPPENHGEEGYDFADANV